MYIHTITYVTNFCVANHVSGLCICISPCHIKLGLFYSMIINIFCFFFQYCKQYEFYFCYRPSRKYICNFLTCCYCRQNKRASLKQQNSIRQFLSLGNMINGYQDFCRYEIAEPFFYISSQFLNVLQTITIFSHSIHWLLTRVSHNEENSREVYSRIQILVTNLMSSFI